MGAEPFVKWVGSKRYLAQTIAHRFPWGKVSDKLHYVEPFLGSGAVFLAVAEMAHAAGIALHAHLSDANEELIATWNVVRDHPFELMQILDRMDSTGESAYYAVRAREETDSVRIAARMIYLNKCGYNGLYRVGPSLLDPKKFVCNVPWGKRTNVELYDREKLLAVGDVCRRCLSPILVRDFSDALAWIKPGSFVYLDPPYHAQNGDGFTGYTGRRFGVGEQLRVASIFHAIVQRGAYVIASNSDTPWIRSLYQHSRMIFVEVPHSVSADGNGRGFVPELLMLGGPGIEPGRENSRRDAP